MKSYIILFRQVMRKNIGVKGELPPAGALTIKYFHALAGTQLSELGPIAKKVLLEIKRKLICKS